MFILFAPKFWPLDLSHNSWWWEQGKTFQSKTRQGHNGIKSIKNVLVNTSKVINQHLLNSENLMIINKKNIYRSPHYSYFQYLVYFAETEGVEYLTTPYTRRGRDGWKIASSRNLYECMKCKQWGQTYELLVHMFFWGCWFLHPCCCWLPPILIYVCVRGTEVPILNFGEK